MKLAKSYEEAGGEYENEPGSKNEPRKGPPEPKSEAERNEELGREQISLKETEEREKDEVDKPEANSRKKPSGISGNKVKARKKMEAPAPGSRRSARLGNKRSAHESERGDAEDNGVGEEDPVEEKTPKKKRKTTMK